MHARELLTRWWRAAPAYPDAMSWRGCWEAALRTVCCGALLWALLGHVRPLPFIDLYPTYVAAHFANEGRWDRIYHRSPMIHGNVDPEWDQRARQLIGGTTYGTSFVYHPWYLSAARPIAARVDYPTFQRGSLVLNKVCIVLIGLDVALLLRWRTLPLQLLSTLLIGVASTTGAGMELGQNVLLALAFSLAAALAWQSRAGLLLGGAFAALAWMCKPWCAILVVLCFALRGLRAGVLTSVALAALMLLLPELVLSDVLMRDYRAMNLALTNVSISGWSNLSVLSIVERASNPHWAQQLQNWFPRPPLPAHRFTALAAAAAVFALGALAWWRKRPAPEWTSAAWLAFMLIPLGICWNHYLVFAFPLACLAALSERAPVALRAGGLALLGIVLAAQIAIDVPHAQAFSTIIAEAPGLWLRAVPMALIAGVSLSALWCGGAAVPVRQRSLLDTCTERARAAWSAIGPAQRLFAIGIAVGLVLALPAAALLLRVR